MLGTKRNHSPSEGTNNGDIMGIGNSVSPPSKKPISGEIDASAAELLPKNNATSSCPPPSASQLPPTSSTKASINNNKKKDNNDTAECTSRDYYFDSYSHHGIHEEMLKDEVRTKTYQMAILNNKHLFENKNVLDVGCGTGILSMFAVQAGAAHVYAVDCSSIIEHARRIVADNGMADKITLIRGKMEEIDLPVPHVDIIVSEWMGYFLLYESMLNTVLYARDRWLKPEEGIVFPDKAVMYLCAVEHEHMKYERIDFWENVYGFDMRALKEVALLEPVVDVVNPKLVVTNSVPILNIDLQTCTLEHLSFASPFRLCAKRRDRVHSFVAYFECAFTQCQKPLGFSTSPFAKYTHWKQTIFYLKEPITVCDGEEIRGTVSCVPNSRNARDLDITFVIDFDGAHSKLINKRVEYRLR